jgi:eukaryotic-like serine/threonine-protein kinase
MKQNCWEFKKCGREPGGVKSKEMGVCPASTIADFNGANGGKNSGRICWKVTGTYCKGEVQGSFAQKHTSCVLCDFFTAVMKEEGGSFRKV